MSGISGNIAFVNTIAKDLYIAAEDDDGIAYYHSIDGRNFELMRRGPKLERR